MNSVATFKEIFTPININLYNEQYKNLPENTIAEKLIKLRKINNLTRKDFAKLTNFHITTVQQWEVLNIIPKPSSIKVICDFYNISLKYFGDYYYWFFNNPEKKFYEWKNYNQYSYSYCSKLFNVSDTTLKRLVSGKILLSYDMYIKFKNAGVFSKLIDYKVPDNIPEKLKAWKTKNKYSNEKCANVIGISSAIFKRLLYDKLSPNIKILNKLKIAGIL